MTLNGVWPSFCVILPNSVALKANYVIVVEDRLIPSCDKNVVHRSGFSNVQFLANVNSLYVIGRPSVCRLSVTFVHPTQAIEISAIFLHPLVRWPPADIQVKFDGDRPRGTPPSGELNTRGVAEYSDFGPIERYIPETVQDRS